MEPSLSNPVSAAPFSGGSAPTQGPATNASANAPAARPGTPAGSESRSGSGARPGVFLPPPPSGPPGRRAAAEAAAPVAPRRPAAPAPSNRSPAAATAPVRPQRSGDRPVGYRFEATLDLGEVDERNRPGPAWSGRSLRLSRSNLVFTAKRMCYAESRLLVAVHLIDASPAPLFGIVQHCEYEGDGLYTVDIDLAEPPSAPAIDLWLQAHGAPPARGARR
ncbi:MAG: hypothetical protein AAF138_03780 [Planctomycetota bacterium]